MSYYDSVLPELKKLAGERGLVFEPSPKPTFEWLLDIEVNPGKRSFFSIEGTESGVVGMVVVPAVGREHSTVAWNRIEQPQKYNLQRLEWNGYGGKRVAFALLQIWEEERVSPGRGSTSSRQRLGYSECRKPKPNITASAAPSGRVPGPYSSRWVYFRQTAPHRHGQII